jgi:hypothetical protein
LARQFPLPDSCAATKSGQCRDCGSGIQLIEQRLRFLQIECIEALGEPVVDRSEKLTGRILLTLIAPEPRMLIAARSSEDFAVIIGLVLSN